MPKTARTREEVEAVKQRILEGALEIISSRGYQALTMRRLGRHLGMTAAAIYNYFENKEEIYLHVLIRGFELLHEALLRAAAEAKDPFGKLRSVWHAFVRFGLERSNYYDIMLTLYIPKYRDFAGGPLEPVARRELMTAIRVADFLIDVVQENAAPSGGISREKAREYFLQLLTGMHGIVALYNNTILGYVHERPEEILDSLVDGHLSSFAPDAARGASGRTLP